MIALKKQLINTTISERYATIIYSFDFENTSRHSDELKFAITIDPDAFIAGFTADIDGELFIGRTEEKEEAKQEYIAAKEKNENAILISQPNKEISNVFEIKTNVDSGSKISLNITIEQYLKKTFNFNQLNIQILNDFGGTTIRKNYSDIEYKFVVKDKRGISGLTVPLHSGQIDGKNKFIYNINGKITAQQLSLTNELVLKYKVGGESDESSLLFDKKSNTFCHILSDIITDGKEECADTEGGTEGDIAGNIFNIPRRVVFVIDKSGSMSGNKWNYTVKATNMALQKLRNGIDRYRIILCGSTLDYIPKNIRILQLVQESNINDSIKYLQAQRATGSEQLNQGLLEGIKAIKMDISVLNNDKNIEYNFFMNQIIFISDGRPTIGECNVDKIITNVKNANDISKIDKYSNKISVFAFGVGRDGNGAQWMNDLPHAFLKSLAVNNNGFYKRIRQKTADSELTQYIDIISKPICANIKIKYSNNSYVNSSTLTQTKFNSLYRGNDLIVCGKFDKTAKAMTAVISSISCSKTGQPITINKTVQININEDFDDNKETENELGAGSNNVDRIWAYLSLQQHATKKLKYNDMIEMDEDEQKQENKVPLQLAMKYKFVTPWTSMIVVKHKKKEKENESIPPPSKPIASKPIPSSGRGRGRGTARGRKKKMCKHSEKITKGRFVAKRSVARSSRPMARRSKAAAPMYSIMSSAPSAPSMAMYQDEQKGPPSFPSFPSYTASAAPSMSSNPYTSAPSMMSHSELSSNVFDNEWECAMCTFTNKREVSKCTVCGFDNDKVTKPKKTAQVASAQQKEQKEKEKKKAKAIEAYNKNGIFIVFNFESEQGNISAVIVNNNSFEITKFSFKIIVPNYIKLEINKPANGETLFANSKNSIQQTFKLNNTMHEKRPYVVLVEIVYTENGQQKTDRSKKTVIPNEYFNKK